MLPKFLLISRGVTLEGSDVTADRISKTRGQMKWISLSSFLLVCCAFRAAEGLTVSGPSEPLVARSGDDVILTCSADPPVPLEELHLEWMQANTSTLVHEFKEGEDRPEAQHKRYRNRTELFHEGLAKGNYSLKLNNVTSQDKGGYMCKVYSGSQSGEASAELREVERLFVTGTDIAVSAYAGEDVILNCTVDTHTPLEELEVQWMKVNPDIVVHLFADGEDRPESQHHRFQDRTELFHSELAKGNFSLKLKSVRTEDKGKFKCIVLTNTESAEAFAELKEMGFSSLHIGILVMAFTAIAVSVSTSIPALRFLLLKSESRRAWRCCLVNWCIPCIFMFVSFVLWGVIEGFMREGIMCAAVTLSRILLTLLMASSSLKMPVTLPDVIKSRAIFFIHFVILTVMFLRCSNDLLRNDSPKIMKIVYIAFAVFICGVELLFSVAKGYFQGRLNQIQRYGTSGTVFDFCLIATTAVFLLSYSLLGNFMGAERLGFDFLEVVGYAIGMFGMVVIKLLLPSLLILFPRKFLFYNITATFFFILHLVLVSLLLNLFGKHEKGSHGLICEVIFLYSLAAIACFEQRDNIPVICNMIVYMFGTTVLTVVNAVALITEMMLQADNGFRRVKDLRLIVLPFECLFLMGWLGLQTYGYCLEEKNRIQQQPESEGTVEPSHSIDLELQPLSETKGSRVQQS
ncbi:hypothetical protein AOXY_G19491 [Acipenser oxyrinchus oxyrinchus]|uniref:Ig-like domain-containing protein n=1 Tax=Acipenser oxyrinchus oxyrinchus TaxID=40147 RepID=A0AAD8FYD3_ACIOX|nr:hypothetical protein AOXY_G19491 [Acipenser oxyrinchus oxyrinchus]